MSTMACPWHGMAHGIYLHLGKYLCTQNVQAIREKDTKQIILNVLAVAMFVKIYRIIQLLLSLSFFI